MAVVVEGAMVAVVEGDGFDDLSTTAGLEDHAFESHKKDLPESDFSFLGRGDAHDALCLVDPPESEAAWAASTADRLKSARALRQIAQGQLAKTNRETEKGTQRKAEATKSYQITVRKRMDKMEVMIRNLMDHVQLLDHAMHEAGYSSFHLQRADSAAASQLDVADRRTEVRQQRPPRERVLDAFGKALDEERQLLRALRKRLAVEIDACRQLLAQCEEAREAVLADVRRKRHAMRLERVVWRGPDVGAGAKQQASRARAMSTCDRQMASTQTGNWEAESEQLMNKACTLAVKVDKLSHVQKEFLSEAASECERTQKQTEQSMRKRLAELTDFRKALDNEIQNIGDMIIHVQESLDETQRQCDLYNVPLKQLDEANAIRKQRIGGENIRDSVRLQQGETFTVLTGNQRALQDQHSQQADTLQQMQLQRAELWQDLQDKVAALNVDIATSRICIRPKSGHNVRTPCPPPQRIKKDHFRRKHMDWGQNHPSSAQHAASGTKDPRAAVATPEQNKHWTDVRPASARPSNQTHSRTSWNW
eukprot:TRINITY_DN9140_c0_g1_i2.p1 TRINITY_DN9140_c0_g1~~TRINITY_DN9140_c0_g1_i2.p1  ORF type:complete len:536 (-),score=135.25 TRINITY_DN9140_c0_g1_i2:6-1613(-)